MQSCCLRPQFTCNKATELSIHSLLHPEGTCCYYLQCMNGLCHLKRQGSELEDNTTLDDTPQIVIQMYHTKGSMDSIGKEFLI